MATINDVEIDVLVGLVVSSDGDLGLAAERLNKKLGLSYNTILEYELEQRISELDSQTTDSIASKFRALLTIRLYKLIYAATTELQASLSDLKPAELARTHASLVNSFTALTAPATKVTFDFELEAQRIAEEFKIPVEDIRGDLKQMETRLKAVR